MANLVERVEELERLVNRLTGVVAGLSNHVGFDVDSALVEVRIPKPAKPEPRYEDEADEKGPADLVWVIRSTGEDYDMFFQCSINGKTRWTKSPLQAKRFGDSNEANQVLKLARKHPPDPDKYAMPVVAVVLVDELE